MKSVAFRYFDYSCWKMNISNGTVINIVPINSEVPRDFPLLAKSLVDIQVNGYKGIDFNSLSLTSSQVESAIRELIRVGVLKFMPTLISNSFENILNLLKIFCDVLEGDMGSRILGFHLEGPFISPEDGARGAHPRESICPPDFDFILQCQKICRNQIRLLTMSPHWLGTAKFIRECRAHNIMVSIGHSHATPHQINTAIAAGATLSTHLGNGCAEYIHRHQNNIWAQLANENNWISLIADGHHLPDEILRVFLKSKKKQCLLVSDTTAFGGMPPGNYHSHIGGRVTLTETRRLHLEHQHTILAGSANSLLDCVNHLLVRQICSVQEAWELASSAPLQLFQGNLATVLPRIGDVADFVLLDDSETKLTVKEIILEGKSFSI